MKKNEQPNTDLRALIITNLENRYQAIYHKPLPAILTSTEVIALGIRPRHALASDASDGIGLKHLPGTGGKGRPREYLLSTCIDAKIQGLRLSHA